MRKLICGVYVIRNLITQQVYVGSSIDVKKRFTKHRVALKKGAHKNPLFQTDWILYGSQAFDFSIQELCEEASLEERESFWIKYFGSLDSEKGYNYSVPDGSRVSRLKKVRTPPAPSRYICLRGEEKLLLSAKEIINKLGLSKNGIACATAYWRGKIKACKTYKGWIIVHSLDYKETFDYFGYDKLRDGRLPVTKITKRELSKLPPKTRKDNRVPILLQNSKTGEIIQIESLSTAVKMYKMVETKIRKCINAPFGKHVHHGFYIKRLETQVGPCDLEV